MMSTEDFSPGYLKRRPPQDFQIRLIVNSGTSNTYIDTAIAVNEIYQYFIVSALMDGVAANGIPVSRLLEHGDLGLGTFRNMVGELILFDGRMWQMKCDGTVEAIDPSDESIISPFAMITRFQPALTTVISINSKDDLSA